mmetsp:Transcript_3237/g.3177  ORF Transcript_3237/g.3177 Transcript_3237/m.3177 type:complete len:83 (+) Transcript_3237:246-494(+)
MNSACVIKVSHTPEFHNSPNNSLKPALKSVLEKGLCSDIKLLVGGKEILANKCILVVRSAKFQSIIKEDTNLIIIPNVRMPC